MREVTDPLQRRWYLRLGLAVVFLSLLLVPTMVVSTSTTVNLPWGDINVLVLTDTHSWIGGHSINEPKLNVDYGEVLSFYQRLLAYCNEQRMDLWFVVNGDWIDGTGLSMNGDISYLTPLLERMPWDAVNVGNHELYDTKVVNEFMRPGGFVESWGDRYISSNVLHTEKQKPLGYRYRFLRGQNATVLTFGFLYNMEHPSPAVTVERVEEAVEEDWFRDVVTNKEQVPSGNYDAIMVMAHMDVQDELVTVLLTKIRALVGESMPVQFITGHTHYRGVHIMDDASVSFEAGRFLDTIGFVSFPKQDTLLKAASGSLFRRLVERDGEDDEDEDEISQSTQRPGAADWSNVSDTISSNVNDTISFESDAPMIPTSNPTTVSAVSTIASDNEIASSTESGSPTQTVPGNVTASSPVAYYPSQSPTSSFTARLFHHKFIDTDVEVLKDILAVSDLDTEDGSRLSKFILDTRTDLGLLDHIGCAPESYYLNRTVTEEDSLWRLFLDEIAPYDLLKPPAHVKPSQRRMFLASSDGHRYDMIARRLVVDDVIAVSPFNETIYSLGPDIPGHVIKRLVKEVLNKEPSTLNPKLENYVMKPALNEIETNFTYEVMAPEWGLSAIVDGLVQIKYNGTVQQVDSGYTTTDVWLDYVRDIWICKDEQEEEQDVAGVANINPESVTSDSHGIGLHTKNPYAPANAEDDRKRLIMALIGVSLVVVLGGLYILQLHRRWLEKYRHRQRLIFAIDQENDNELI